MKCSLGISNYLDEISSLSYSIVFLYFFALITEEGFLLSLLFFGTLHSDGYIFPFLLCLLLLFFSQLFVRPPQTTILLFSISSSWEWFWLPLPVQYYEPLSIGLQALSLWDLTSWIFLSLPLYNFKGFDLVISEWSSGFPYFLQFKSEFSNKGFMIWATVSSQSCFCWLYRTSPSLIAKNIINLILLLTIWWYPCVESSLVLLEEGVCYDWCVLLAKLC